MDNEKYCGHPECCLEAIAELVAMAEILKRDDLVLAAAQLILNDYLVRCRHVPRHGGVKAPLP